MQRISEKKMTRLLDRIQEIIPGATLEVDEEGEFIVYTDLRSDDAEYDDIAEEEEDERYEDASDDEDDDLEDDDLEEDEEE